MRASPVKFRGPDSLRGLPGGRILGGMRATVRFACQLLFLWAFVLSLRCGTTGPGGGGIGAKLIDCSKREIFETGVAYVGRVNKVLTSQTSDDKLARAQLIDLGVQAGEDVLACLLRDQGFKYAEASRENPNDVESATAKRRSEAFSKERGYQFK
jgi:hypothetical protein